MSPRMPRWRAALVACIALGSSLAASCAVRSAPPPDNHRQIAGETHYDQNGDQVTEAPDAAELGQPAGSGGVSHDAGQVLANPPPDSRGQIVRDADGACFYYETIECEPEAPCKPPPPLPVRCQE